MSVIYSNRTSVPRRGQRLIDQPEKARELILRLLVLAPAQRQGAFKYTEHTEHTEHAPHIAEHTERRAQSAPEHGAAQSTAQSEEESTAQHRTRTEEPTQELYPGALSSGAGAGVGAGQDGVHVHRC